MQRDTSETLYLGFASQKGGVGKSSLAEVLASVLYYERGIPLLVVDCDSTQESFFKLRERERDFIESDAHLQEELKSYFLSLSKPSYTILRAKPEEAIAVPVQQSNKLLPPMPKRSISASLIAVSITL